MTQTTHRVIDIGIEGMSCASCVARAEKAIAKLPNVHNVSVNLASESARIEWNLEADTDDATDNNIPTEILRVIRKAGYIPKTENESSNTEKRSTFLGFEQDNIIVLLGLLMIAPLVLPMLLTPWLGATRAHALLPIWLQAILGSIVQFTLGVRFYRNAWHAILQRTGTMDVLVALGTTAAWALSMWIWWQHSQQPVTPNHHAPAVYFESSAVIIVLVRLGKWLEARARKQAVSAITSLQSLRPNVAHWLIKPNKEQDVPVAELLVGDIVRVKPGERLPADGEIIEGSSYIDASMLTGEPIPVEVTIGSKVAGGTLNGNGVLTMQVKATATESVLAHIIRLVQDAQAAKPPIQKMVDKVAAIFVPTVLIVAVLVLLGWLLAGLPVHEAILRAVAVLVIACPCALGLATPAAIMAGTGIAAKYGILIKNSVVLEQSAKIDAVVFDKTGTLTQGKPTLSAQWQAQDISSTKALHIAAALQQGSEHPLAKAVLQAVPNDEVTAELIPQARNIQAIAGCGIQGQIETSTYMLGSLRWVQNLGAELSSADEFIQQQQAQGSSISALVQQIGTQVRLLALFTFADSIKPHASETIQRLQKQGIKTFLISGDNNAAVTNLAQRVGLSAQNLLAETMPQDKAAAITQLQQTASLQTKQKTKNKSFRVAMIGDGINDAPALAAADVGIAIAHGNSGNDVALHASDITIMHGEIRLVSASFDIARRTVQKIRQNLFWAFIYNAIGIPLAAFGLLSPMLAGAAMALSSVSVISNALLLRRWKP